MANHQIVNNVLERAFLVGASIKGSHSLLSVSDSLDELALLSDTAGMDVVGQASQSIDRIDPATFIGSGKVEEIKDQVGMLEADVVVFDDELSPRHQRELEKRFGEDVKVIDRSALILDIFAQHARTREGALQVELAQYEYRLPRLDSSVDTFSASGWWWWCSWWSLGVWVCVAPERHSLRWIVAKSVAKLRSLSVSWSMVRAHRGRHRSQRERVLVFL